MSDFLEGRIVKALSGFYYVREASGAITQCRARGIFRKERITPLVGDMVSFSSRAISSFLSCSRCKNF